MSIRLVRKASETPNIANRDDTCAFRYAYGTDGYVLNYGYEMGYALPDKTTLRIQGGRLNIQGWEVDLENYPVSITVASFSGVRYDFIYAEINLLLETAEIKTVRDAETVFPLSLGDNLTYNPNGVARLPLYRVPVNSSGIDSSQSVEKLVQPIKLSSTRFEEADRRMTSIEERLALLGFREGTFDSIVPDPLGSTVPKMTRQGNYVLGKGYCFSVGDTVTEYWWNDAPTVGIYLGKVPSDMKPLEHYVSQISILSGKKPLTGVDVYYPAEIHLLGDGTCYLWLPLYETAGALSPSITIWFGYEAKPLT